jgi:hypothetical protein
MAQKSRTMAFLFYGMPTKMQQFDCRGNSTGNKDKAFCVLQHGTGIEDNDVFVVRIGIKQAAV